MITVSIEPFFDCLHHGSFKHKFTDFVQNFFFIHISVMRPQAFRHVYESFLLLFLSFHLILHSPLDKILTFVFTFVLAKVKIQKSQKLSSGSGMDD